jgi:hypothetical protein
MKALRLSVGAAINAAGLLAMLANLAQWRAG